MRGAAPRFLTVLAAELRLLARRPAVQAVLVGILLLNVLPGYLGTWATMTFTGWGPQTAVMAPALTASHAHVLGVTQAAGSGILALALGAVVIGSDYTWATGASRVLHTAQRIQTQVARFTALVIAVGVTAAAMKVFLIALMAGFAAGMPMPDVALPSGLPPAHRLLAATGLSWLILVCWAAMGALLAAALRSAAAGWGLGIVYVYGIERTVASSFDVFALGGVLDRLALTNLGRATVFLLPERAATDALGTGARLLDPAVALAVLLPTTTVLVIAAVTLTARQDL